MSKENLPRWAKDYWTENPTDYTSDDIYHIEPNGLSAILLKKLALKSGYPTYYYSTINGEKYRDINGEYYVVSH